MFELTILMSHDACSWIPFCVEHKIWYLFGGFAGALALTLINLWVRFSGATPEVHSSEKSDADDLNL